jgi:hypothetical protein
MVKLMGFLLPVLVHLCVFGFLAYLVDIAWIIEDISLNFRALKYLRRNK